MIRLSRSPSVNPTSMSASTTTQVVEKVTEVTRTDSATPAAVSAMDNTVIADTRSFMTRNNLWAYLLVALIVLVIIFWFAVSGCKRDIFEKLHCKGVEWVKGSSGNCSVTCCLGFILCLRSLQLHGRS